MSHSYFIAGSNNYGWKDSSRMDKERKYSLIKILNSKSIKTTIKFVTNLLGSIEVINYMKASITLLCGNLLGTQKSIFNVNSIIHYKGFTFRRPYISSSRHFVGPTPRHPSFWSPRKFVIYFLIRQFPEMHLERSGIWENPAMQRFPLVVEHLS